MHPREEMVSTQYGYPLIQVSQAAPCDHEPAQSLLSAVLRYHNLTHSLTSLVILLDNSLQRIISTSQPDSALEATYDSIVHGPAISEVFLRELTTAVKAENTGGRASSSWNTAITALAHQIECSIPEMTIVSRNNKRGVSRQDSTTVKAVRVAIQCRMLACLLKAAHGVSLESDEAKEALVSAERAGNRILVSDAGDDSPMVDDVSRPKTLERASALKVDSDIRRWTRGILLSGGLRIQVALESLGSGHQEGIGSAVEDKLLLCAKDVDAVSELRNQAVSLYMY